MGFEDWVGLPRWLRAGIALGVLAYPAYLLTQGVIWPWGLAAGGVLLVLSIPRPLGPRSKRPSPWNRPREGG